MTLAVVPAPAASAMRVAGDDDDADPLRELIAQLERKAGCVLWADGGLHAKGYRF